MFHINLPIIAVSDHHLLFFIYLPSSLPQESWEDEETESKPVETKTAPTVSYTIHLFTNIVTFFILHSGYKKKVK